MFTGDKSTGMLGAIQEVYPHTMYQRRTVHACRNVLDKVPRTRRKAVAASLKAIHAQESRAKCLAKARELRDSKLESAARVIESGVEETPAYALFPPEH